MITEEEKCMSCKKPVNLEHDLLWDLEDLGTWCGECDDGLKMVIRCAHTAQIVRRRDELMEKLPFSRPSIEKLDHMLNLRFANDFGA